MVRKLLIITLLLCSSFSLIAQKLDSPKVEKPKTLQMVFSKQDTGFYPKRAIIRSAILPGWGQITNKKYWKLPIVYGALGTTAYVFFSNLKTYKEARAAYINATDGNPANDIEMPEMYYNVRNSPSRIASYRNSVRQDVDYSVLFFIGIWGLNVADAAVDAHLKSFDVSDDLSFHIKAGYSPLANTAGLILSLNIK